MAHRIARAGRTMTAMERLANRDLDVASVLPASPLPPQARVVIVGGGIIGASIAYHLTRRSEKDVVMLERGRLTNEEPADEQGIDGRQAEPGAANDGFVHGTMVTDGAGAHGDGAPSRRRFCGVTAAGIVCVQMR